MLWKLLPWILRGLALAIVAAALHYHLPQGDVVRINGTEVKRMDVDSGELRTEGQPGATRDVRFINAVTAEGRTRVYRNEDTRWGFPPYLKFDSADITAQAQDLARRDSWALVQHYGWRIQMLSMFPNVVELTEVEEGYEYFPWAAIITLTIILGLLVAGYVAVLRLIASLHLEDRIGDLRARLRRQMIEWRARLRDLQRP